MVQLILQFSNLVLLQQVLKNREGKKMKKYIIFLLILIPVLGFGQDKSGFLDLKAGATTYNFSCSAADTINESDSLWVELFAPGDYPSMQDVYIDIDSVSGAPEVTITLWGKKFSGDSYTSIGTAVTYYGTIDTTFVYSVTTANRYRYFKLGIVTSATTQQVLVSAINFKFWFGEGRSTTGALSGVTTLTLENGLTIDNATDGTITFSRDDAGTVTLTSADNNADADLTVEAGGTGVLTLGDAGSTTAITSSDWAIGATGIATGMGAITSDGKITTSDTIQAVSFLGAINFATPGMITGTADSIVITNNSFPALAAGVMVIFIAEADNTGAVEIDYNGTVDNLYETGGAAANACDANDVRIGTIQMIVFDGTQWQQISNSGN